jgi:hypothetical protein
VKLLAVSFFSAKYFTFLQHYLSLEVASPHRLFLLSSLPHVRGGHHLLKNKVTVPRMLLLELNS